MNSQFQNAAAPGEGREFSAADPPHASLDRRGTGPSFPADASGRQARKASSHTAPRSSSGGSEALLEETQDAVAIATDSVYAASGAVRDAGAQISEVVREAMRATASAISTQAAELTSNITHELSATAESQKERGADAIHRFARAIRTAAHELDDGSPEIARQIRAAASSVDSLSDNLHSRSVGDLFKSANEFARSQPAAFFAGAVIAGFALSRFLQSSSQPPPKPNSERDEISPPIAMSAQGVVPSAPSAATF